MVFYVHYSLDVNIYFYNLFVKSHYFLVHFFVCIARYVKAQQALGWAYVVFGRRTREAVGGSTRSLFICLLIFL